MNNSRLIQGYEVIPTTRIGFIKLLICFSFKDSWALPLGSSLLQIAGFLAEEAEQFGVYFFRVRPCDAVRTILHYDLSRPFDELGRAHPRSRDGKDAVGIPLDHQRGHIDPRYILPEVFMPGWDAREAGGSRGAARVVQPA